MLVNRSQRLPRPRPSLLLLQMAAVLMIGRNISDTFSTTSTRSSSAATKRFGRNREIFKGMMYCDAVCCVFVGIERLFCSQPFNLSDLNNCEVMLCDHSDMLQVDRVKDCKILIAACCESAFLRNCENCTITVAWYGEHYKSLILTFNLL